MASTQVQVDIKTSPSFSIFDTRSCSIRSDVAISSSQRRIGFAGKNFDSYRVGELEERSDRPSLDLQFCRFLGLVRVA